LPPPKNPADQLSEAYAQINRIARELFELVFEGLSWATATPHLQDRWRGAVRVLLYRGTIRPSERSKVDEPLAGQTTIEEALACPPDETEAGQ